MKAYKNVYKIENGALIENTENKLEYKDESGKHRIKTNPTFKDFAAVGKFPLSKEAKEAIKGGKDVRFFERNGEIYPVENEVME